MKGQKRKANFTPLFFFRKWFKVAWQSSNILRKSVWRSVHLFSFVDIFLWWIQLGLALNSEVLTMSWLVCVFLVTTLRQTSGDVRRRNLEMLQFLGHLSLWAPPGRSHFLWPSWNGAADVWCLLGRAEQRRVRTPPSPPVGSRLTSCSFCPH